MIIEIVVGTGVVIASNLTGYYMARKHIQANPHIVEGPPGPRGAMGPKGDPGKDGLDFDEKTIARRLEQKN